MGVTIYKLYSLRTLTIKPKENSLIHSGIAVEFPQGIKATVVVLPSIHNSRQRYHLQ